MNFATWSIRNPIPSIVLFIMLTLAGLWGFFNLPVQDFPDLQLPAVSVELRLPGAAPAQLETEVARKVEDSVATLNGLAHIQTTVLDGVVRMGIEFDLEKPLSDALIETKDAVDRIRSDLPVDLEQPSISAVSVIGEPMITFAVSNPRLDEEQLSWFVDDTVAKTVLAVPGVGSFSRVGGVTREVLVEVDPVQLFALDVSIAEVSRALQRVQQEQSGGRGQIGSAEQAVRTIATVRTAQDLAALPIAFADGRTLRLDQIATVVDTYAERTQAALLDGEPVVGFQVVRARGFDDVSVADGTRRAVAELMERYPGLAVNEVATTVNFTLEQYEGSMQMLYEGALLAILVVWWFLRDWRATLVAAAALPLSIIPAFGAMHWADYSLNTITLLALAAVVGILVDDAIVEVENIVRHLRQGKPVKEAAAEAVTEIGLAVVATTATIVVVFLPTAFMSGIPGLIFKQFGWTAVFAVVVSLLVARVLTPMMAAHLLRPHAARSEDGPAMQRYLTAVRWCLAHRKTVIGVTAALFFGSLLLVPLLPTGFIPAQDRGFTRLTIELPPGSSVDATLAVAENVRRAITDVDGIESVFATVGEGIQEAGGGQVAGEVRRGVLTLTLAERGSRPSQLQIERALRERLRNVPGARFSLGGGGAPGEKLQMVLAGDNAPALKATAQALERELRGLGYLQNITSTASLERPEIVIRPNAQRMAERGVTTADVGATVRIATSGDFDPQLAKLNLDTRQIDIRVRFADRYRTDLAAFGALRVPARERPVPLASIAELAVESGPTQIDRYDRKRYVAVTADLAGFPLGEALAEARALPSMVSRPSSVDFLELGDVELMGELFSGFAFAMVTGILLVLAVLVLLFKDFLQPVTILSALPLSIVGSLLALLVTRDSLSLPSLIGLVMLMGIVTKNSILLVDYTFLGLRDQGLSMHDALLDACHKRARPIIMTSLAMIAGMVPLALGLSGDASFRQPMAITVIGGLITSTGLSLLIVPVVFTYVLGFERRVKKLFGRPDQPSRSVRVEGPA